MGSRFLKWRWHGGVLLFYAALSWLFLDHGASLSQRILGAGQDPSLIMWFLTWWPYALSHHLNPFFTTLIWQPAGLNLAWTTCVPLLALLGLPFTLLSGPVLAYNVLTLLAPALAAFGAYILCLQLTRHIPASVIGGYLFGFSSYEMAQAGGHLNLAFTIFIPCLVLLVLRRCAGGLGRGWFVLLAGLTMVGQFLVSIELCATLLLVGGLAWALAFGFMPARRAVLWRLVGDGLLAGVVSGLLLSPVLYAMFGVRRDIALPPHWPVMFSTDALNLLIPTMTSAIGGGLFLPVSGHFSGFLEEQDGYIGIVLLLIVVRTIRAQTDPALARFLGWLLAIILLASFGPQLWLGGMRTNIALPWALVVHLPLLKSALPGRLMVYAALLAAVIVALFVAAGQQVWRLWLGILACLSLLPVPHPSMAVPYSAFFAPGRVQQVLGTHAKVLIVPFGIEGPSSFWQAENRFGFAQTGGYLGFPPGAAQRDAAMMRLYFGVDMSAFPADFTAYCHATGTQYVIAGPGTVPAEWAALRALDWRAERIDDVTVYVVPPT